MKSFVVLFLLAVASAFGQANLDGSVAGVGNNNYIKAVRVSELQPIVPSPQLADQRRFIGGRYVRDGVTSTDCTVGGGSNLVFCVSDGNSYTGHSTDGSGGATAPATTNLYGGNGALNGLVAKTPDADYQSAVMLNAKVCGATGDGTTNDSVNVQACINKVAGTRSRIFFPPGNYVLTGISLPTNTFLEGSQQGDASRTSGVTFIDGSVDGNTPIITVASGASASRIEHIGFYSPFHSGTSNSTAIYSPLSFGLTLRNLFFNFFDKYAFDWESGTSLTVDAVSGQNLLLNRPTASYDGTVRINGTDARITNLEPHASVNSREGHSTTGCHTASIYLGGTQNFLGEGVIGELDDVGIYIPSGAGANRLVNVRADLNMCQGIINAGSGNIVVAASIYKNGADGDGLFPGVLTTGSSNAYVANIVEADKVLTAGFSDTQASDTLPNAYVGNSISGNGAPLYSCAGAAGCAFLTSNKASIGIADATASPVINSYNFYRFGQTTPISITTLTGGVFGQLIYFLGNTNVTLATGGNISPLGGTHALVASVIYPFINSNGTWIELGSNAVSNVARTNQANTFGAFTQTFGGAINVTSGSLSIPAGEFYNFTGRSRIASTADGNLQLLNNAFSGFGCLQLGGGSASFPCLNRNGTSLEAKLADVSAYTNFNALTLGLQTSTAATCAVGIRGQFQYTAGGAGVKDIVEVCAKDVSDVYAWRAIY